jgi:ABC-2 type transport system permease protein
LGFEGDIQHSEYRFCGYVTIFHFSTLILIFLIPAITMRSFADEKKGTLELLLTKPLSLWQIVNGKFLGALLLIVLAIIPTFIYVSKSNLGMPEGNIDMGSTIGSYAD